MDIINKKFKYNIYEQKISPPFPILSTHNVIGFDPGTAHLGIAMVWRTLVHLYEVEVERSMNPVERILATQAILSDCVHMFDYAPTMIIEGSSFGSNYRNTELAEVRASAILWAVNHEVTPIVIPIMTIRKAVFGNGRQKAEETWKDLPPNAASALACAYYKLKTDSISS